MAEEHTVPAGLSKLSIGRLEAKRSLFMSMRDEALTQIDRQLWSVREADAWLDALARELEERRRG